MSHRGSYGHQPFGGLLREFLQPSTRGFNEVRNEVVGSRLLGYVLSALAPTVLNLVRARARCGGRETPAARDRREMESSIVAKDWKRLTTKQRDYVLRGDNRYRMLLLRYRLDWKGAMLTATIRFLLGHLVPSALVLKLLSNWPGLDSMSVSIKLVLVIYHAAAGLCSIGLFLSGCLGQMQCLAVFVLPWSASLAALEEMRDLDFEKAYGRIYAAAKVSGAVREIVSAMCLSCLLPDVLILSALDARFTFLKVMASEWEHSALEAQAWITAFALTTACASIVSALVWPALWPLLAAVLVCSSAIFMLCSLGLYTGWIL